MANSDFTLATHILVPGDEFHSTHGETNSVAKCLFPQADGLLLRSLNCLGTVSHLMQTVKTLSLGAGTIPYAKVKGPTRGPY